jgi:transglutaminase-like putative cysteine protease
MRDKLVRWWDFPAAVFLTIAIFASVIRLETTNWTLHLSRVQWMVLLGLALGMAIGKSRFSPRLSFLFGTIYTLFFLPWSLASLIDAELWIERLQSLFGRLSISFGQLTANRPVNDPILILAFLVALYWFAGIISGYQLTRNARPWFGLMVAGVVVLIVDYSFEMYAAIDTGTALSLVFFLFSVILIARIYYLRSHLEWTARGQMIENEVGFDISRGAAIAALGLVLISWLSPRVIKTFIPGTQESQQLSNRFQELRDRVSNAVSSLNSQAPLFVETLGSSLSLGGGTNLSDEIVFSVEPESGRLTTGRYYWTGRIYDAYLNGQWISTETERNPFGLGATPPEYTWIGRREVSVEVDSRISLLRTLYYPNAPISISRAVQAEIGPSTLEEPEITALISDPPVRAGEVYTVRASISTPTITQLRNSANLVYPEWVSERYLQLPPNLPPRIRDLAASIGVGLATPYDQVTAVTDWLRNNITYETNLPEIPADADPVEWFLFDNKAGYCNYYATAEVLMLRSLGIPARMSVGYAEGTWNPESTSYEVAGKDYHAWPEVYFPEIGWVAFEPTAAQPVLDYPSSDQTVGAASGPGGGIPTPFIPPANLGGDIDPATLAELEQEANRRNSTRIVGTIIGTLAVGLLAYSIYRWRKFSLKNTPVPTWIEHVITDRGLRSPGWLVNWSIRARRTPMEKYFARVPEMLRVWGQPADLNLTPAEQVQRLVQIVPEISGDATTLLNEYQHAAYSRIKYDTYRARRAAADLRQKGYQVWFKKLIRFN